MSVPVKGDGPINFSFDGSQYLIPLSELSYSGGKVDLSAWFSAFTSPQQPFKDAATGRVDQLVTQGQVTAGTVAPAGTRVVMVLKSRFAGGVGNQIHVLFTPNAGTAGTFDATVSATQTYAGLKPATVEAILGTGPGAGSSPGLVYVTPGSPAPVLPRNGTVAAAASGGGWEIAISVFDTTSTSTALTLSTVGSGAGAAHTSVTIANADQTAGTFDLTVTWQYSAAALTPAGFQADSNVSYLLDVEPPTTGGSVGTPGAATVVLGGGTAPQPASASVLGT